MEEERRGNGEQQTHMDLFRYQSWSFRSARSCNTFAYKEDTSPDRGVAGIEAHMNPLRDGILQRGTAQFVSQYAI